MLRQQRNIPLLAEPNQRTYNIIYMYAREETLTSPRPLQGRRGRYLTLGCKLNFAETSALRDRLEQLGAVNVGRGEEADFCIVNTCSVTGEADHKCRQAIHRLVRENPGAVVAVMGCYAQLRPADVAAIAGVSLVVGQERKGELPTMLCRLLAGEAQEAVCAGRRADIRTFVPSCSCGDRTRYFLKVQDGCNYGCTYCTIPAARGRSRNGSIASLVQQAEEVAQRGGREIVLTGVNIGDFGRTTDETLLDLLRALDTVEGISRYRISSIEPNLLTEEIIDFCAASRAFMPHFHLPLQSGSDEVLELMHRRYRTDLFRRRVEQILSKMPDAFIGVDVIVGARGETEERFEQSARFIASLPIAQLHVFSYSERPGTRALSIPHVVTPQEKNRRCHRLIDLSEEKRLNFYKRYTGCERNVLWEHRAGWTDNYVRVLAPTDNPPLEGSISRVRLARLNEQGDAFCT